MVDVRNPSANPSASTPTGRRSLGRGLSALLADTDLAEPGYDPVRRERLADAAADGIHMLAVDHIQSNPHQPRMRFEDDSLLELAASIREHGIIQPLIVTQSPDSHEGYWLVAGERRWRAAQLAGLTAVPAIVREATPQQLLEWALVENLQRADLNPLEEARAFQELTDRFQLTQAQVAARVGRSRSAVANTVRLLQLPQSVQAAVLEEQISAGHARALLALPDEETLHHAFSEIMARSLSVRDTEALVRRLLERSSQPSAPPPERAAVAQTRALEDSFRAALSTRVKLERNPDGSGRLVIHFYDDGDLDMLFRAIVGQLDEP